METTEYRGLKVGNWIKFRHKDFDNQSRAGIIQAIGKVSDGRTETTMYRISIQGESYQVTQLDIDVLPLTEEYIMQLGFEKVSDKTFRKNLWTITTSGQEISQDPMRKTVLKNNGFNLSDGNTQYTVYEVQVVQNIMDGI